MRKILETIKKMHDHFNKQNIELEARIKVLEETVFALKSNVKEQKKKVEVDQKKKWLNSYPDQTKEG
jgi:predicted  nucleic acid-binding Zn-ribbon protein